MATKKIVKKTITKPVAKKATAKKVVAKTKAPSPAERGKKLAAEAEGYMKKGREAKAAEKNDSPAPSSATVKQPVIYITVQAQDGKWIAGPSDQEAKLRKTPKGQFKTAEEATQDCMKNTADVVINTAPPMPREYVVEGLYSGKKRKFRIAQVKSPTGASHGSFQVSEVVDDALVARGYALSRPSFEDACRVSQESTSSKPIRTGTHETKHRGGKKKKIRVNFAETEEKQQKVKKVKVKEPKAKKEQLELIPGGVSLKKVCADADIDPKLARRILRAKGGKPGGRWEWTPEEAPKIIKMLKEEAAKK